MAFRRGYEAKLYYKTGGVGAGGSFTELTNCRDVTLNLEKSEADVTTRASAGFRWTAGVLKDASIEFEMVWDPEDAGFAALRAAWFSGDAVGFQVLDADSGEGLQADMEVMTFSRAEPIDGVQMVSVTIKPCYSTTAPSWVGA